MKLNKSAITNVKWCIALKSLNANTSLFVPFKQVFKYKNTCLKAKNSNYPNAMVIGCKAVQEALGITPKDKTISHTAIQIDKTELITAISYSSKPLVLKQSINKDIEASRRAIGLNSKNYKLFSYR